MITTVSGNPFAIGYASVASVKDSVKLLSINNVIPNNQTIKSGSYEIQRPFILVTKKDVPLSKWAQEFFDFALSPDTNKWIEKAGVVPAN